MHAIISMMLKNVEYRMYNLILTWIYKHSTLILTAQTFSNWKHRLMLWSKSLVNAVLPSEMKVPNACSNREITKEHTFKLGKREARLTQATPYPVQPTPQPSVTQWFWMLLAISNFWIVQSTKKSILWFCSVHKHMFVYHHLRYIVYRQSKTDTLLSS